jgi:hypothetical protein
VQAFCFRYELENGGYVAEKGGKTYDSFLFHC